jgi:tetratricopeptide (TPR) repeat protein
MQKDNDTINYLGIKIVIELNPKPHTFRYKEDESLFAQKLLELDEAVNLNPNESNYNNRGYIYWEQNKYGKAWCDFNEAIKLNPKDAISYSNRACCAFMSDARELREEAITDICKAIELDQSIDVFYEHKRYITDGFYSLNTYEFQFSSLKEKMKSKSDDFSLYRELGRLNLKRNANLALIYYSKAIDLNQNNAELYNDRSRCYYELSEYKDAIDEITKVITLNQNHAYLYNNRGLYFAKNNEFDAALKDFNKAIDIDQNFTDTYLSRAQIYHELSRFDDAIQDYKTVIKLSQFDREKLCVSYYSLATIYYFNENKSEFFLSIENAIENCTADYWKDVYLLRHRSFIDDKKYEQAREYVELAFKFLDKSVDYKHHILNIETLERKELEIKNKDLEQQIQLERSLHEKEKEMLSFFTHTMRNALATAPESLREVIRLLGSDDYEKNTKHYKAINKIVTLFSTLSLTDCLIDTFKQSISDQKEFKQSWQKDCDGDATPKWVVASALRQSLNRIIFMSDTDKLKMLLNNEETGVVKSTRKSFIDNVLPLDVDDQGVKAFYNWVGCINLIEIAIDENSMPHFGTNQVKFSLLFSITSELILNAFKYWSGVGRIQISWKLDNEYYIFTVKNPCEANASSNLAGTHKGVAFIKRLMELLGEQAEFYCGQEEQSFVAELKLHKTLLDG